MSVVKSTSFVHKSLNSPMSARRILRARWSLLLRFPEGLDVGSDLDSDIVRLCSKTIVCGVVGYEWQQIETSETGRLLLYVLVQCASNMDFPAVSAAKRTSSPLKVEISLITNPEDNVLKVESCREGG